MKPTKQKTYSKHELARRYGCSRETASRYLVGAKPAAKIDGHPAWTCLQFEEARIRYRAKHQRGNPELRAQLLEQQIRLLKLRSDLKEGIRVPRVEAETAIAELCNGVGARLQQALVNELPSTVSGLDVEQVRIHARKLKNELMAKFVAFSEKFAA